VGWGEREKHPHEILKNNLITQIDRGSIYEKITYHSRQWGDITPYIIQNSYFGSRSKKRIIYITITKIKNEP
jgi:hypothetical protein